MRYIYIFDINEVLIDRYPAAVAKSIKEITNNDDEIDFIFLYTENYYSKSKPQNLPLNSKVYYKKNINTRFLNSLTEKFPPVAFVGIGLRIPDLYLFTYFNKKNIKTYMIQHGIFTAKLERLNPLSFAVKRYSTIIKSLRYIYSLSKLTKLPFFNLFYDFYQIHFKNELNLIDSKLFNFFFISSIAFIYDKSWDKHYIQRFGYNTEQFVYIGNPDYDLARNLLKLIFQDDSICYICQSMVEDGRYNKDKYLYFLKELKFNLKGRKLHLKLHPRSDLKLYESFIDENFTISNDLINCSTYIGHYSSLIKVPFLLGRKVILWELDGHSIPKEFLEFSSIKINDWKFFKGYVNKINSSEFKIHSEMNNHLNNINNPISIISNFIKNNI